MKTENTIANINRLEINRNKYMNEFAKTLFDEISQDSVPTKTLSGNILVCLYNEDKQDITVKGMFYGIDLFNFNNEYIFITDGEVMDLIGDEDNNYGYESLEEALSFNCSKSKIDKNIFNTDADYFVVSTC